ncbi:MAG TPA: cysteine synthase family protein [Acidobacteriota bacterium]|jgi:cysteine synthase A
MAVHENALGMVGNTPLVNLKRLYSGPGSILAKAEFVHPGGSVKDRAALRIISDAYKNKVLRPDQPVVEMTSGNMGAGLAVVCNVTGNPFIAVMSVGNSPERAKMLQALGTEVVLTAQVDGRPGQVTGADISAAVEQARKIAHERGAFYVDQFNNPGTVRAHEDGTGPEIWTDLGNGIDAFVASIGSGGTFVGTSRFLKRQRAQIRCAAVEPDGCEVLAGKPVGKSRHLLQGTGYGIVPPQWDASLADFFFSVSDSEATHFRELLALKEGLHVGFSAAANVCASVKLIESGKLGRAPTVVTILCDTGLKY